MKDFGEIISIIKNSQKTLFILCGFPYAGKSYLANQIITETDAVLIRIDDIFHAYGFDWDSNTLPDAKAWEQIFNDSYERTKKALIEGKTVLYDSTNQTVASRDKLREVAQSSGADTRVIYVKSPITTVWRRWEENQKNPNRSVVSRDLVQMTIDMFEEPLERERVLIIENS